MKKFLSKCYFVNGKSSFQIDKIQYSATAKVHGWEPIGKLFHIVASLKGDAAEILELISKDQKHTFIVVSNVELVLNFREK